LRSRSSPSLPCCLPTIAPRSRRTCRAPTAAWIKPSTRHSVDAAYDLAMRLGTVLTTPQRLGRVVGVCAGSVIAAKWPPCAAGKAPRRSREGSWLARPIRIA
jgi:hypothetical protein